MNDLTVGIDIGGTNTKFGIVDREGNVIHQGNIQTTGYEHFQDFFDSMAQALRESLKSLPPNATISGIGIGAANGNYYTGNIEHATNLRWKGVLPLSKMFREEFNVPCILTNDANAAAVGEMIYGNAKSMKDFVVVTLGTGLGSGFVCGGLLLNGHHGIAGELGHTSVNPTGRYCNCGKRGCLETYVSATGIKRTVYKLLADHLEPSELRGISFDNLNTKMITDAQNVDVAKLPDPQPDSVRVKPGHDQWSVLIGICTHLGCIPIAHQGPYDGYFCPCHGSTYDLATGKNLSGPAPLPLPRIAVKVRGGAVVTG